MFDWRGSRGTRKQIARERQVYSVQCNEASAHSPKVRRPMLFGRTRSPEGIIKEAKPPNEVRQNRCLPRQVKSAKTIEGLKTTEQSLCRQNYQATGLCSAHSATLQDSSPLHPLAWRDRQIPHMSAQQA